MGAVSLNEAENYGGQGGAGYFSLKQDGEVVMVQFLYDSAEDIKGNVVHEVQVGDKKRYVNCLRTYDEPVDNCPFCKAGQLQKVKFFIPLVDTRDGKVKIWERGRKFISKIASLCARYSPLSAHYFEIERHGKANDTSTTYEIYPMQDVPGDEEHELPTIIGGIVLDKTAEDMEYYLNNGSFPDGSAPQTPVRRTAQATNTVRRRTPVGGETF